MDLATGLCITENPLPTLNEGLRRHQMPMMSSEGATNQSCMLENSMNDQLGANSDSNFPSFYNSSSTIGMDNNGIEKCTQSSPQKVIILVPKM